MSTLSPRARHLVAAAVLALLMLVVVAWALGSRQTSGSLTNAAPTVGPSCGPVLREPAGGSGRHIDGEPITYDAAPPAYGDHRSRWEVGALPFYDVQTRPEVAVLVHNLEHGYNILWYDQSVVDDPEALARVREIAGEFAGVERVGDPSKAFIAAPWTEVDGGPFPDGMRFALTHWYADPQDRSTSRADEVGLTRYCSDISADVVRAWMRDYPLLAAPEGFPDLM